MGEGRQEPAGYRRGHARGAVFRVDAASGKVTRLTGEGDYGNVHALPAGGMIATMNTIMAPDDLYRLDEHGHRPD